MLLTIPSLDPALFNKIQTKEVLQANKIYPMSVKHEAMFSKGFYLYTFYKGWFFKQHFLGSFLVYLNLSLAFEF